MAARNVAAWWQVSRGRLDDDPYTTFERIMDLSEAVGVRSAFYFICGRTCETRDGDYRITDPHIRRWLRRIHERGHEIGLHPSYDTYRNAGALQEEFATLQRVCSEEGIAQESFGGRHHFLRWATPETFGIWDSIGLAYDSTLGFADRVGFRCGTCYEYPTYDVGQRRALRLRERPLVAMDFTLMDDLYMGLGCGEEAASVLSGLKETCRFFGGDFTVLWHNSRMIDPDELRLYQLAIAR